MAIFEMSHVCETTSPEDARKGAAVFTAVERDYKSPAAPRVFFILVVNEIDAPRIRRWMRPGRKMAAYAHDFEEYKDDVRGVMTDCVVMWPFAVAVEFP